MPQFRLLDFLVVGPTGQVGCAITSTRRRYSPDRVSGLVESVRKDTSHVGALVAGVAVRVDGASFGTKPGSTVDDGTVSSRSSTASASRAGVATAVSETGSADSRTIGVGNAFNTILRGSVANESASGAKARQLAGRVGLAQIQMAIRTDPAIGWAIIVHDALDALTSIEVANEIGILATRAVSIAFACRRAINSFGTGIRTAVTTSSTCARTCAPRAVTARESTRVAARVAKAKSHQQD